MEGAYPFLTAQWRNLVMFNYEVNPALLIDRVPTGTTLDFFQGKTYVSLVGFQFLESRILGAPIPFHQDFEEINLRFYVRCASGAEVRTGVVFICEVVPRAFVGGMARLLYREPYTIAPIKSEVRALGGASPAVTYEWEANGRWNRLSADAMGPGAPPAAGSLDEFLTVRHWGYNGQPRSDTLEYRVEHPPWTLWRASRSSVEAELQSLCGAELGRELNQPACVILAEGSPVTIYWRTRLS